MDAKHTIADANAALAQRPALLRLPQIIGPSGILPIAKSTWWAGVASGRYPKPVKLGPRITAWRTEDIDALVTSGVPHG